MIIKKTFRLLGSRVEGRISIGIYLECQRSFIFNKTIEHCFPCFRNIEQSLINWVNSEKTIQLNCKIIIFRKSMKRPYSWNSFVCKVQSEFNTSFSIRLQILSWVVFPCSIGYSGIKKLERVECMVEFVIIIHREVMAWMTTWRCIYA